VGRVLLHAGVPRLPRGARWPNGVSVWHDPGCGKAFCRQCLSAWTRTQPDLGCPLCRQPVHGGGRLNIPVEPPAPDPSLNAPHLQIYYAAEEAYVPLNNLPPAGSTMIQALEFVLALQNMDEVALAGYEEALQEQEARQGHRPVEEARQVWLDRCGRVNRLLGDCLVHLVEHVENTLGDGVPARVDRINVSLAALWAGGKEAEVVQSLFASEAPWDGPLLRPTFRMRCDLETGVLEEHGSPMLRVSADADLIVAFFQAAMRAELVLLNVYQAKVDHLHGPTHEEHRWARACIERFETAIEHLSIDHVGRGLFGFEIDLANAGSEGALGWAG